MDAIRLGLSLRALRIRRGLRQIDVAGLVGVSRSTISNLELGRVDRVSVATVARVATAVGASLDVRVRWHGADLDRLLDEGHARLVNHIADRLRRLGWEVAVEVTFAIRGERGSIDLLGYHPLRRALLVNEMKTVMPDFQAMILAHDRKARLGAHIARERGWNAATVSRLLVIESGSTARDRVARLGSAMEAAYPDRGARVRSWLAEPSGTISGLLFVRSANRGVVTQAVAGRQRVRRGPGVRNATGKGTPAGNPAQPRQASP